MLVAIGLGSLVFLLSNMHLVEAQGPCTLWFMGSFPILARGLWDVGVWSIKRKAKDGVQNEA